MKTRKRAIFIGISVLVLSILACTLNVGGPDYPDQRIPVSTEALEEFQASMQTAAAFGAATGETTLVITEPQLTSYLAYRLQAQSKPLFTDPQVYLRDGQIQIYGTAQQGVLQATIALVVTAGVDEQGKLALELTSADFGPLPLPEGLNEAVTATLEEAYTGAIGPSAIGFRLTSITIANGTMTIVGRVY